MSKVIKSEKQFNTVKKKLAQKYIKHDFLIDWNLLTAPAYCLLLKIFKRLYKNKHKKHHHIFKSSNTNKNEDSYYLFHFHDFHDMRTIKVLLKYHLIVVSNLQINYRFYQFICCNVELTKLGKEYASLLIKIHKFHPYRKYVPLYIKACHNCKLSNQYINNIETTLCSDFMNDHCLSQQKYVYQIMKNY